jgi:hypothetical protein
MNPSGENQRCGLSKLSPSLLRSYVAFPLFLPSLLTGTQPISESIRSRSHHLSFCILHSVSFCTFSSEHRKPIPPSNSITPYSSSSPSSFSSSPQFSAAYVRLLHLLFRYSSYPPAYHVNRSPCLSPPPPSFRSVGHRLRTALARTQNSREHHRSYLPPWGSRSCSQGGR